MELTTQNCFNLGQAQLDEPWTSSLAKNLEDGLAALNSNNPMFGHSVYAEVGKKYGTYHVGCSLVVRTWVIGAMFFTVSPSNYRGY